MLFELRRPSLGERVAEEALPPGEQRAYVRSLRREARALRSSIEAKGVELGDVAYYERVWNGFAATIATDDLPRVQTLGVRVERVRRFFPATETGAEEADRGAAAGGDGDRRGRERGRPAAPAGERGDAPLVALLDSGVDLRHPALRGRVVAGRDAVDGDRDPSPGRAGGRVEQHGTQLAGVLADALGDAGRVRAIRVAEVRRDRETGAIEAAGTTDRVLAGLEHAVDPDGDGATDDALPVALVGVSSPYAGFADAPEAEAAAAASALGMLVVAPAGNEGRRAGRFGPVGSPAAAAGALAVGALEGGDGAPALPSVRVGLATRDGRAVLDGRLLGGGGKPLRAPATGLTGPSQADPEAERRAAGADVLEYFTVGARPRARGKVVVVRAGAWEGPPGAREHSAAPRPPSPAAIASAAAAAGAAAVVICDPEGRGLRAVSRAAAGGIPVVGLSGEAAERALDLTRDDGEGTAFLSAPEPREADGAAPRPAASSSAGPTYDLRPKPDVHAPGTATAPVAGGGSAFASGTSVAAARVAAEAARLHLARPDWTPDELAAALAGTAGPLPDARRAAAAPALADPRAVTFRRQRPDRPWRASRRVALRNPSDRPVELELSGALPGARGVEIAVAPRRLELAPRARETVTVRLRARNAAERGFHTGALEIRAGGRELRLRMAVPVGPPAPAPLGDLELVREGGQVRGVRFTAGAVRGDGAALAVLPLGRLALTLAGADGRAVRELTPPGGASDLLPGEYAYTLTEETLGELPPGDYRFEAEARGPGSGAARSSARSPTFHLDGP